MSVRQSYDKLAKKLKQIYDLSCVSALLSWDQQVLMPKGGAAARGSQMATLESLIHQLSTSNELESVLKELPSTPEQLKSNGLDEYEVANVRDARRDFAKRTKLPSDLVEKLASLQSKGFQTWITAKEKSDFAMVVPVLEEWINLLKQKAQLMDPNRPAYEVLLDDYERGMTVQRLDQLFVDLKKELIPLISSISKKPAPNDKFLNEGKYDVAKQAQFCKDISKQIGFDFDGGRMDTSEHPFCTNFDVKDVRITTKYSENEFVQGIFAAVHETGHALYEQGLNKKHVGLPVSFALSMGMHESQSLFWERMIALSDPFWKFYYPKLQETFPQLKSLSLKDYLRSVNKVEPSLIRIEADELTYVMHIIIRYEIEKGLFDGTIKVADMSKIFNSKMKDYVGIDVPSDSKGVLQDVHWYEGLFGYFPTYTLGAIYASQLYKQAANDIPDIEKAVEIGNFGPIKSWLNAKVHEKGSLYTSADELMKTVTNGTGLDSKVFVDYLKTKYSKLYEL